MLATVRTVMSSCRHDRWYLPPLSFFPPGGRSFSSASVSVRSERKPRLTRLPRTTTCQLRIAKSTRMTADWPTPDGLTQPQRLERQSKTEY